MMVCCTTTWTLGKNIWKIVFIWARTFLLPIKQPSSYNFCTVVFKWDVLYWDLFLIRIQRWTKLPLFSDSRHISQPLCALHVVVTILCTVVYFCGAGYGWKRIRASCEMELGTERQPFKCNGLIEFVKSPCQHPLTGRSWTIAPLLCGPFALWGSYLWSTIKYIAQSYVIKVSAP